MCINRTSHRLALPLLAGVLILLPAAQPVRADRGKQSLSDSQEWIGLARLWQTLLDHSSNEVYNPSTFQSLAADLDKADGQFAALTDRGAIPKPIADYLKSLFHSRYQYLAEMQYTTRSNIQETPVGASRHAALWVLELQLGILRRPILAKADEELAKAAETNVAFQLTYLSDLDEFQREADQRRAELKKRQDAGEKVDLARFDEEVERRQNRLLDAYRQHALRTTPIVKQAMPYILSLTRQQTSLVGAGGA